MSNKEILEMTSLYLKIRDKVLKLKRQHVKIPAPVHMTSHIYLNWRPSVNHNLISNTTKIVLFFLYQSDIFRFYSLTCVYNCVNNDYVNFDFNRLITNMVTWQCLHLQS